MKRIVDFMKRNYKIILLITILSAVLWSFVPTKKKEDPEKDKLLLELLTFVLEKGHYDPIALDDTFSAAAYKEYLNSLDPSKRFFIQSDIDEFSKYELQIDDMVLNKDLTFFELTYTRLIKRMEESRKIYKNILSKSFNFATNEKFNVDYEKQPFAKNDRELKDRWRKQLQLSVLSSITDKQKLEEDKKTNDSLYQPKSFEKIEKESRESTLKSLDEYFNFIEDELERADWFSIYINALVERFDPHTFYFYQKTKRNLTSV